MSGVTDRWGPEGWLICLDCTNIKICHIIHKYSLCLFCLWEYFINRNISRCFVFVFFILFFKSYQSFSLYLSNQNHDSTHFFLKPLWTILTFWSFSRACSCPCKRKVKSETKNIAQLTVSCNLQFWGRLDGGKRTHRAEWGGRWGAWHSEVD